MSRRDNYGDSLFWSRSVLAVAAVVFLGVLVGFALQLVWSPPPPDPLEMSRITLVEGLHRFYNEVALPIELHTSFHEFFSPGLSENEFKAKPIVLFLGQYSTGKTTFLEYLLGRQYPGSHISPEPSTGLAFPSLCLPLRTAHLLTPPYTHFLSLPQHR